MEILPEALHYMVNHVVLPPKLPQADDWEDRYERTLMEFARDQAIAFQTDASADSRSCWAGIVKMLTTWLEVIASGSVSEIALKQAMTTLRQQESIALHIRCQNAGLIIRRVATGVTFEVFEAMPLAAAVMGSKANLRRTFPGRAIQLSIETLNDPKFIDELASFLHRLDTEQVEMVMAKTIKANSEVLEERDSTDPALVTELLFAILAPYGKLVASRTLAKRNRDDVCWNNAKLPWRRSPMWLVLKVAIELSLINSELDNAAVHYKNFMVYLVAKLSRVARIHGLSAELLFLINAKAARRASKIADKMFGFVESFVLDSLQLTRVRIEEHVTESQKSDLLQIKTIVPSLADTALSLTTSKPYLYGAVKRQLNPIGPEKFSPSAPFRLCCSPGNLPSPKTLQSSMLLLADFETWVRDDLKQWLQGSGTTNDGWTDVSQDLIELHCSQDCQTLKELVSAYKSAAITLYSFHPEYLSLMLLTIMELWCSLDLLATAFFPLLKRYPPEIPTGILQPLLLPQREQLVRLHQIERYLERRHRQVTPNFPSLFGRINKRSISVQHFNNCKKLQDLRSLIERDAAKARESKREELERLTSLRNSLNNQASRLEHLYKINRKGIEYHVQYCHKCSLENQANNIHISIHEWPLPALETEAKAAVFELQCPIAVAAWRDATFIIVQDLGRSEPVSGEIVQERVFEYQNLKSYYSNPISKLADHLNQSTRISIGSNTKSFLRTHYKPCILPVEFEQVALKNGLRYELLDTRKDIWTKDQIKAPVFDSWCISTLCAGPYSSLQWTVDSTRHTQNEVLAKQTSCSTDLTMHEYLAFSSLRAGERLQWYNIVRELGSSNLQLNADAVRTLLTQAAWQAGSALPSSELRESHFVFEDPWFCTQMQNVLARALEKIEANWKELNSMNLLVILSLRMLSLVRNRSMIQDSLQLLAKLRRISLQWTRDLAQALRESDDSDKSQQRILEAALTCRLTYFVDSQHVDSVLGNGIDIATFIECSIHVHDSCPDDTTRLPRKLQQALLRDQRVAHFMEHRLAQLIRNGHPGVTAGIKSIWQGAYLPDIWELLPVPLEHWATTKTAPPESSFPQLIHYNLLSGQLLVDGRRLGRLPAKYTGHPLYKKIFGTSILDVVSADETGMSYRSTRLMFEHEVYFGFANGDFLIRIKNDSRHLEAVPSECFQGDLPADFVNEFVHWLDLDTGIVEFRIAAEWWISSSDQWRLPFKKQPYRLLKGQISLIDPRSSTCSQINKVLSPIESAEFIHVTLSSENKFQVDLPRFRLQFLVDEAGQLKCPELSTVVDRDQTIGTLFGLKNKLVMQGLGNRSSKARRSLFVPYGMISTELSANGTNVHITTGDSRPVRYFSYQFDQRLKQLRSGSDLLSHLYKAYLHAVTSLLLPDPFICCTGTEAAFTCLEETGAWSCAPLSSDVMEMLHKIARLAPIRKFYPSHLRSMQQIQWNEDLTSLTQHAGFITKVEGIVRQSNRFSALYEAEVIPTFKLQSSEYLQERAMHRNSPYYGRAVQNTKCTKAKDCDYRSRDRDKNSEAGQQAFELAQTIKEWPSRLELEYDMYNFLRKNWPAVHGFGQSFNITSLAELLKLPLSQHWGSLYTHCCNSRRSDSWSLTFLFSILSFGKRASSLELRSLLALAFADSSRLPRAHPSGTYKISHGHEPQKSILRKLMTPCEREFKSAESEVPTSAREREALKTYKREVQQQSDFILREICRQWPQHQPPSLKQSDAPRFDIAAVTATVGQQFKVLYRNYLLYSYFEDVKLILQEMNRSCSTRHTLGDYRTHWDFCRWSATENPVPSLSQLLRRLDCPTINNDCVRLILEKRAVDNEENTFAEMEDIISRCSLQNDETRITYCNELLASLKALKITHATSLDYDKLSCLSLVSYQRETEQLEIRCFEKIRETLQPEPGRSADLLLSLGGLWPCINPRVLLSKLSHSYISKLQGSWKRGLLAYGDAITNHQKAVRLLTFAELGNEVALRKELRNKKDDGWSPYEQPDWRLLEIENDFLIRPIQARVANEMMAPSSTSNNFVMQLNMGEGKSSVIIPMLVCALADGSKLARCIVLKPLAREMEHLLKRRLGGLVDRRVYYAPFSRKTSLTSEVAGHLEEIYHECKNARGILLIQPEHILSFKLMGIDRLFSKDFSLAIPMINIQNWLERTCRDILDESDELLHVNFELAYTVGSQQMLDGQPARWIVAQALFSLIEKHGATLHNLFPLGIEWISRGQGSFPTCRILDSQVGARLMAELRADILNGHVSGLSLDHCGETIRDAVSEFIAVRAPSPVTINCIAENFRETVQLQILFLLRGLIGHGILLFALERKRWLVNYGLDLQRCLMAVPYRAKSTPSVSAEFAHPDVAILLTCLSYYYTGLTDSQLRLCFLRLGKTSDPSLEYHRWQQRSELPPSLRNFAGVNLDDDNQWNDILVPHLRQNKLVIDYFLNCVVFPREGKGFPHKLSTSAWDLPADHAYSLTTGFSGTNDNRLLLPLNIQQQDLRELEHTSAMVLNTLLREENREYVCASGEKGQRRSVVQLLQLLVLKQPAVRVLLDVGAQVLEIDNQDVVEEWLQLASDVKAGIFFDTRDELMVVDRDSKLERLIASSFRERLGECVVYLDEAHTRGTDLPLPINYRAAVTLGPELTKDRFVQACMRMRNLGHGQSIICFAPPEVHESILNLVQKPASQIDISHVIQWTLEQTCRHIRRERALWTSRGLNHTKRRLAYDRLLLNAGSEDATKIVHCDGVEEFLDRVKDREALSLEEMYSGSKEKTEDLPYEFEDDIDDSIAQRLFSEWRKLDKATQETSKLHEEQEREVAHEIEQERQIQRPPEIEPKKHKIHQVVRNFILTGRLSSTRDGLKPAFECFQHTTADGLYFPALETPVFATDDFIHAVHTTPYDDYIRPVSWVLVGKGGALAEVLLLSPYEANELLPMIRDHPHVSLHVYAPRTSKSMFSFGRLDFLSTSRDPSRLAATTLIALNLFAGTSYFDSFQEYQEFCNFCDLIGGTATALSNSLVTNEGFVLPAGRSAEWDSAFQKSPLPLIKALLGMRRKGDDWTDTHMGRIVDARVLREADF
ncbi:hypothetical protein MMC07_001083 [Pseudocyphellaria aurata]|nr:hypothetical protein [Pseudocyphellaria aurata]